LSTNTNYPILNLRLHVVLTYMTHVLDTIALEEISWSSEWAALGLTQRHSTA